MVPEPRDLTKAEPTHPREPSSPRAHVQEPLILSSRNILEKIVDETASPTKLSLDWQRPGDVEVPSAEPEPVCDEPKRLAEPVGQTKVEPMEVEEEPQRV